VFFLPSLVNAWDPIDVARPTTEPKESHGCHHKGAPTV
jgi:hypothetical protein